MALELSDDQQAAVDPKRKADLPTYFDSDLQTKVEISRDFEAFLILSTSDLKTSAINWIKTSVDLQNQNKDRDALVGLAIGQEILNATNKMNAIDDTLDDFNTFRVNFQTNADFAAIPEVQQFLFDLQRPIDELAAARDRAQFDQTASQVIQRGTDELVVTAPEIEELQSWTGVLSVYL